MKWWHIVLAAIGLYFALMLFLPPSMNCKLRIWQKNACANTQTAADLLNIDPNAPLITQGSEIAANFRQA